MTQDSKNKRQKTASGDELQDAEDDPMEQDSSVNPRSSSNMELETAKMDTEDEEKNSKFVQSLSLPDYRSFRLSEIIPGSPWPENLQQLVRDPTSSRGYDPQNPKLITLAEMTSLLCHAALVEVGFVPENPDGVTPLSMFTMPDLERCRWLGGRVNPNGYNSSASIFTWRYQVVNAISDTTKSSVISSNNQDDTAKNEETEKEEEKDKTESKKRSLDGDNEVEKRDQDESEASKSNTLLTLEENIVRYEFSPPCNIIMVPKENGIQIFCNFPGFESSKPFQLTVDVDIRSAMENNTPGLETIRQPADEWMRMMNLNGVSFSSTFKRKFATFCLDAMNGIMFELRGLVCLPPEILIQIFAYCDIKTIRNIRLTCRYLNDVGNIPALWRMLIKRDFGSNPSVPAARFARFFNRTPYELSPNLLDAQNDYKAIYEAQHRVNFRTRFDIGGISNRLAPRHSWMPYVTPPRPYLFRVSYDVPPQSLHTTTPHSNNNSTKLEYYQNLFI